MSRIKVVFGIFTVLFLTLGCTKKENAEVNLSIWGSYLSPEALARFTKETGIKVNVSNFTSNEELLAKVQTGGSGIDVAVPSDYMVDIMRKLDLLKPLDMEKIGNKGLIAEEFLNQSFDPGNKFSLPYAWTTAGIAINRDLYKGKIETWKDVLENPELKGKFSLLDDAREVTAAALKMHGYSVNTINPDELKKAQDTLVKAKSKIKMFKSDVMDPLLNKEIAVAHSYSTDALQAIKSNKAKIEFILPKEGGTKAMDNLVILKSAKNVEAAQKLLNFMLSAEVNVEFVTTVMGGPVLKATRDKLPEELKNNSALFPPSEVLNKYESIIDLGDQGALYDDIWTKVKTE